TEAKVPMIAITTSSSMRVNPRFRPSSKDAMDMHPIISWWPCLLGRAVNCVYDETRQSVSGVLTARFVATPDGALSDAAELDRCRTQSLWLNRNRCGGWR